MRRPRPPQRCVPVAGLPSVATRVPVRMRARVRVHVRALVLVRVLVFVIAVVVVRRAYSAPCIHPPGHPSVRPSIQAADAHSRQSNATREELRAALEESRAAAAREEQLAARLDERVRSLEADAAKAGDEIATRDATLAGLRGELQRKLDEIANVKANHTVHAAEVRTFVRTSGEGTTRR